MLTLYTPQAAGGISACADPATTGDQMIWADLYQPDAAQVAWVRQHLGVDVPSQTDMQEIELSSRLYVDDEALVMTMPVLHQSDSLSPDTMAICFILTARHLITVRYTDPKPFAAFARRIADPQAGNLDHASLLLILLDQNCDRLADILERTASELEQISQVLFHPTGPAAASGGHRDCLRRIGRAGDLATRAKESLLGLQRIVVFLRGQNRHIGPSHTAALETLLLDTQSIAEHDTFLSGKINFLLDATLGLINIEQNSIIKVFSVAAVAFLPPTLIASIYGMNFRHMPEISWPWGYPLALAAMLVSALVPLAVFKRKRWL